MTKHKFIERDKKVKAILPKLKKGVKVTCDIERYGDRIFTFDHILEGLFNNNAAKVHDEKGNVDVLPLDRLHIVE